MCVSHAPQPRPDAVAQGDPDVSLPDLPDRLFQATIGTLELYSVFLGGRLGLYETLRGGRARTAAELADEAGVAARYAQEWLEQQAVAGFVSVAPPSEGVSADERRYVLPERHGRVLCDALDPEHLAPFADMLVGIAQALPAVVDAYRSGGGVPYAAYGEPFRSGQGAINRPAFAHDLCASWLPALPDVEERLRSERPARVVEVGCGLGHATRALADAYPYARVVGCDTDTGSIDDARRLAEAHGSRARFLHGELASVVRPGSVDLVLVLETLHDLAHPRETLEAARASLAEGGCVLVADERVADRFVAPGDDVERMMYGWSVSHCLPSSLATPGSAGLGTVLRADRVRSLARDAGFARCEVLPIENELFRFYRLG